MDPLKFEDFIRFFYENFGFTFTKNQAMDTWIIKNMEPLGITLGYIFA